MSTIEVRDLHVTFGRTPALEGVSLSVDPAELVVVLGPTGAGKTTLLRTIAGLETPASGELLLDGEPAVDMPPAERDVALVFQNFSLYPHLSVRDNLAFPLRAPGRNLSPRQVAETVEAAAETLRIAHLLDRSSARLSGGEMQRVAIGRAIVRRPRLFLMDEPLSNLDAKLREILRIDLLKLVRELGTATLFVTHDQREALSMADKIVVLSQGRVHQVGAPRDVYLTPASPLVARQLGQPPINLFEARRDGDRWVAEDGTFLIPARGEEEARATLGVRPEHVAPEGGRHDARVEVVEDTGPARILLLSFAGRELHVLTGRDHPARPGDTLKPRLDPDRTLVWTAR